jgi:hypothetical protein
MADSMALKLNPAVEIAKQIAADKRVLESIESSLKDIAAGRTVSFNDVFPVERPH